ncbi:hypothetical protein K525DRAFT_367241 [Schizophyllum commune Loenen D]|nr:hypothetical protein K525DRAFT_367241 [Schizophyllum commune Loenen D]
MPIARRSRRDAPWVPLTSALRTGSVGPGGAPARAAGLWGNNGKRGADPSSVPSTRPAPAGGTLVKRQTDATQGQTTDMSSPATEATSDTDTSPATTTGESSPTDTRTAADTTSRATTEDAPISEPSTRETGSDSDPLTSLFSSTEMPTSISTPRPTSETSESTSEPSIELNSHDELFGTVKLHLRAVHQLAGTLDHVFRCDIHQWHLNFLRSPILEHTSIVVGLPIVSILAVLLRHPVIILDAHIISTEVVEGGTHTVAHTSVSTITQTGVLGTNPAEDSHGFDKNTGAIVGVAIAAVAGVVAAALLLFIGCKRYRRKRDMQSASSSRVGLNGFASPQGSIYRRAPLEEDDDAPPMTEIATGALPLPLHASSSGHGDYRDEVDLGSYAHGSSSGHGSAVERRPSLSATSHMPAFGQAAEAMGATDPGGATPGRVSFDPGVWIGGKEGSAPLGSPSTEQSSSSQGHGSHVVLLPYHSSSGSSQGHGSHSSSHSHSAVPVRPILKQPTPPSSYIMHSGKADWRQSMRAEIGDTHEHRDSGDARSFKGFLGRLRGGHNSSAPEMRDSQEVVPQTQAHPAVRIPSSLLDPAPIVPGSMSKGKRKNKGKTSTPPQVIEPMTLLNSEEEAAARAANNGMPWPPATLPPTPTTALDVQEIPTLSVANAQEDDHEHDPGVMPDGELDVIAFDDEEHQHPWVSDPHPSPAASEDSRHTGEHLLNPMLKRGMNSNAAAEESMTSLRDHLDYSRPIGHVS